MYSLYSNGFVVKVTRKSSDMFHEDLKKVYGDSYTVIIPNNVARSIRAGVLQGFIESFNNAIINPR